MKLRSQTNYAVRMLMYCASKSGTVTVSEIAEFFSLSETFLTKILSSLTKYGYVETIRGRHGGMRLAQRPEDIRLGDVVRDIEQGFELAECFQTGSIECPLLSSCGFNHALSRALESFFHILNEYTLADLAQEKHSIHALLAKFMPAHSETLRAHIKNGC